MFKKFFIIVIIFTFSCIYGYDLNFDLESQFFYNNFIKNETYQLLSLTETLTFFDAIQEMKVKFLESKDEIKLNFTSRFYLKPQHNKFDYFIDCAYFSYENSQFMLYTGKQRIKWGVGFTWNPTDKLQPKKNIFDPTKDLEGFYALRLEYSNDFMTPSFIVAPDLNASIDSLIENLRLALQLYKLIGTADIYLNGIYQINNLQTIGAALSWDLDFFILNFEIAAIRYIEPSLWVSRSLGIDGNEINYSFVSGLNKSLQSSFFISAEYYYNGWGLKNSNFNNYVLFTKMSEFGLKKNYFSLNFSYTFEEKVAFALALIYGADDSSILFYPRIEYVENSNFNIEIGFLENILDDKKETYYSMPFYNILNLKLKAYF